MLVLAWALALACVALGADETSSSYADDHDSSHTSSHGDDHSYSSDPSVFALGDLFDYDLFIILLSIVGGSAMILELILGKYERYLKREGDNFQSTLYEKAVRELMTLGVVSFALFLLQPVVTTGTWYIIFEFAHYVIFFVAIFVVVQLFLLGASTYPIKRAWDNAAYQSKKELLDSYRPMVEHLHNWSIPMPFLGRVSFDVLHWSKHWQSIDSVQFHLARSIFIRQHGRSADFDFARYAVLVTDRLILSMANIPFRSWLLLVVLHWFAAGLRELNGRADSRVEFEVWFIFGAALFLLEVAFLAACMLGMRRICKKLGADRTDTLGTLDVVLERIWVAPVTQAQQSRTEKRASAGNLAAVGDADEQKSAAAEGVNAPANDGDVENAPLPEKDVIPRITAKDAFFLPNSRHYQTAVEVLMLLSAYHLAVYVVYFISPASKSSTEWFWIILLPLPIVSGVLMAYCRVIPLIALLSTIVVVQPTDIADVEQEAEELNKVRRKLVMRVEDLLQKEYQACAKLGEVPDDKGSASILLKRWDVDRNGSLSYNELEKGLSEIGLVLSSRQRRELLRLADPDRNGRVDIDELTDLLYDVQMAVAQARREALEVAEAAGGYGGARGSDEVYAGSESGRGDNVGLDIDSSISERVERVLSRRTHSSTWTQRSLFRDLD